MDDRHYRREPRPHPTGGYQLYAELLNSSSADAHYPSNRVCMHADGDFTRPMRMRSNARRSRLGQRQTESRPKPQP